MRIVLATTAIARGGVWRHIEDLAQGLAAESHDVVVALPERAGALRKAAQAAGVRSAPWPKTIWWRDVIWHGHLHDTFDSRFLAATALRSVIGPTVLTEHLPRTNASDELLLAGPRRPGAHAAKTAFKRAQIGLADAVIAVSASSAGFIAERYGVKASEISVIPNGLTCERMAVRQGQQNQDSVTVMCAGSLNVQKGQDLLLAAAARAKEPWRVLLVGEGNSGPRLREQARELGSRIAFAGWREDVSILMADVDVICVPSRWESFPYVALEAMAEALPVVGFDVDGVRELVEDGVTGVLVPAEDSDALASTLDRLATDQRLRRAMGEAGRKRMSERYTLQTMLARTMSVYERVAAGDGRQRG